MPKIILKLPLSPNADLSKFVKQCLSEEVQLISIWGPNAAAIEEEIDWMIIEEKNGADRLIVTTAHEGETLEEVIAFAETFFTPESGLVQTVDL